MIDVTSRRTPRILTILFVVAMWSLMVRPLVFEVFVALAVLVAVLWLAIFYTSRPVKL